MRQTTTLETRQGMFFFFVMQCILAHIGTARTAVRAAQLRKLSSLCQYCTNWGIYCFKRLQLTSTLIEHPHEKWWISPLKRVLKYSATVIIYYFLPRETKRNPILSTCTSEEKLTVPVQSSSVREFRLNCVFREPQHCCSWQEHWGRAMETWCQRSENLNHTPIHLLSKTPQSKKAGWANRDRVTKRQWEQKNRIKFNRVKRHRQREDEQENFFFCLLPFCWCLHHPRVPIAAAVLPAEGKVWCSVVRNINVPIVICLSLLQKQLPLSTGLLSVSSLGYRCWGLAHQPGSQMAVVLLLLPLVLLCSSKAKAMGTWSITQH